MLYCVLIPWATANLAAGFWLLYSSIKTNKELFKNVWALPKTIYFGNYVKAWKVGHLNEYYLNSIIIVFISVVLALVISSMASYILARFNFHGQSLILSTFISGMMVPIQLMLVPLYLELYSFGLVNTRVGMILVYVATLLPFNVFVLTGFFKGIPSELEEAAAIDGASELRIYWQIMFPLATPGLVTVAIFDFLGLWNEYLLALVLLSKSELYTLPLGIYNLENAMTAAADYTGVIAGFIIMMIPILLVFIILQKRVVAGLTVGALKQ